MGIEYTRVGEATVECYRLSFIDCYVSASINYWCCVIDCNIEGLEAAYAFAIALPLLRRFKGVSAIRSLT